MIAVHRQVRHGDPRHVDLRRRAAVLHVVAQHRHGVRQRREPEIAVEDALELGTATALEDQLGAVGDAHVEALRDVAGRRLERVLERVGRLARAPLEPARGQRVVLAVLDPGDLAAPLLGQLPEQRERPERPAVDDARERPAQPAQPGDDASASAGTTTTGMCAWRVH